jgi:two-component system CheB/CheR fusion protein
MAEEPEEGGEGLFPIVGIGASAGGLEAFTDLLQALPADTGMGYVFVQHLDPRHVSLLTDLLQRHTHMPVREAADRLRVEPNHVYVIPRNAHMSLVRGVLALTPRQTSPLPHMPIDPFLRSLAADQKSKAIGVILSGNASDGALGMMAIKATGGITFAQSGETAKYDGMPRSAVAAGCIDFVLSPQDIARELDRLGKHPYIAPQQAEGQPETTSNTEVIVRVLSLLRQSSGVDFAYYKPTTIRRRIFRRMALHRFESLDRYVAKLRGDPAEVHALYEDILINVTEFFRDRDVFDRLKTVVFPRILPTTRDSSGPIRIWAPGCSSGEEVYSIAMALIEFLEERSHEISIQIFGTDISEVALDKARGGVYAPSISQDLSPERLRRFFTKVDSGYQIGRRIREMCVFARQNLTKDPPFSRLDLISCRNVLIYLGPVLQKRILPVFYYALKPNGFLLLGSAETIGSQSDLFTLEDKKARIYLRRTTATRVPPPDFAGMEEGMDKREPAAPAAAWSEPELLREADRIVLGKYAPAGVVVDDEFNILQFRGHTSPYLEPSPGMANLNVVRMSREGLSMELRNALLKARREGVTVRREGLRVRQGNALFGLNFEVIPFREVAGRDRRFLILFEPAAPEPAAPLQKKAGKRESAVSLDRDNTQLRQELAATREYLQSVIEEHESSNEELRAANEEIQSSNEELQSTNEELETAKEELQSTNEELHTVNEELQTRNAQLGQAGNDLLNLLSNVNIPIIMLGNDLRIRRFTPVSQRALNLIAADIGRPISDINLNLEVTRIDRLLLEVIETLTPRTMEVRDRGGRPYSLRIRPYRTEDNKIDGVVMVLVDLDPVRVAAGVIAGPAAIDLKAAARRTEELKAFSAGLLLAQERERRNVALELHDDFSQRLALLELNVETMQRKPPPANELGDRLDLVRKEIDSLSEDLRRVAYQLHPASLESLGLVAALESFTRTFGGKDHIAVRFTANNVSREPDADTGLCLYRALQESLHNVARHSGAHSVEVTLTGGDVTLELSVKDSGSGFAPEAERFKGGLGLLSMEERANLLGGAFRIISAPGEGTEVIVAVPYRKALNTAGG